MTAEPREAPSAPTVPASATEAVRHASTSLPPLVRRNTILLTLAQAFIGMGNQAIPTLVPLMTVQMLGSATLAGLGTSLLSVSRLVVAYPTGYLTDHYGRKAGMLLGMTLTMLGAVAVGAAMLAGSFALVIVGVVIFGMGVGAGQQLRLAAADMFLPARRAEGLGYVLTGSLVGAFAAPLLFAGAQALERSSGANPLMTVWFLMPLVVLPSLALVLAVRPDPKTIAQNLERYYPGYVAPEASRTALAAGGGLRVWLRHYPLATAYAVNFAAQGVMAMMMAMTSLALSHHGHALPLISLSVSIHVVGMFGPSIPLGRLSDRFGRRPLMLAGLIVLGAGSILVPRSQAYLVITLGTFLVGVGWAACTVASSALITEVVTAGERGRAVGLSDSVSQLASMVMPLAAGPVVVLAGLESLSMVVIVVLVAPLALVLRLRESSPGRYAHG